LVLTGETSIFYNTTGRIPDPDMPQKPIELILARQLSSHLTIPVFIVDPRGTLLFYNEPAEKILGERFEETGEMPASEWSTRFTPMDREGKPIPPDALPLMIALTERRPAKKCFYIRGVDGIKREIDVTAFPITGQADRFLGGVALFWETGND
jgi:PAS domain-containing protein